MTESKSSVSKASRIQVISLTISLCLLIGWNLIWLSTLQDSDGFHLMPGWGLMKDNPEAQDLGFIPLLPLFVLLVALLILLVRNNRENESLEGAKLAPADIMKTAGMTFAIIAVMVLLPQLSGIGPSHGNSLTSSAEMLTHLFGLFSIAIPLFILGLMFKTYQRFHSGEASASTIPNEEE